MWRGCLMYVSNGLGINIQALAYDQLEMMITNMPAESKY